MTAKAVGLWKKGEWIAALILMAVCALAALLFSLRSPSEGKRKAVVTVENETRYIFVLDEIGGEKVYPLDTEPKTWVKLTPEGISFVGSQCPDKICMGYGVLSKPGESAVCLPAKAMIRIVGEEGVAAATG